MRITFLPIFLFILSCGGSGNDSDFSWEGTWKLDRDSFQVINDCQSCGNELIQQFPDLNIFEDNNQLEITVCSGARCTALSGRFNSTDTSTEELLEAEGEFAVIPCPDNIFFRGDFTSLALNKVNNNQATFSMNAIEQTLTGSCGISIEGTINRD